MTSNYIFNTKHYAGIICLAVSIIFYFTNRKIYYFFFVLTLTIGLIGFLDFYITSYKIGFAGVGINPVFLGLIVLFFGVSKKQIDTLFPEKNKRTKKILDKNLIKSFESKFTNKTVTELNEIADENSKFTDEAKTAAKKIIIKKKNML